MCETLAVPLGPPRLESRDGFLIAGLRRRHILEIDMGDILQGVSRQWHSFRPRKKEVPRPIGKCTYGVCLRIHEGDVGFDYFCGMQVADAANLPKGFTTLAIPALRYAVFRHTGPSSMLVDTYFTIFGKALPEAGLSPADGASGAPDFIECFDQFYDTKTEMGGPEIMVPLKD
jgi:AraC family transcriptional regulator